MTTVNINELLLVLQQMKYEGFENISIIEDEGDADFPPGLFLQACNDDECMDFDEIYDSTSPMYSENKLDTSTFSTYIPDELIHITRAFDISRQYFKHLLDDKSISADERSEASNLLKIYERLFNIFVDIVE